MGWNVHLTDDRGHEEGSWSFTHNCNGMANATLTADELREGGIRWWTSRDRPDIVARLEAGEMRGSWWYCLDAMPGPAGAAFLDRIIRGLEADPERFRALNPGNGWGDFDSFVKVLTGMRDAVPEWPTTWAASG